MVRCNIHTVRSLQDTNRLFTATHPEVVHYNTPTGSLLQHTHKLFTSTHLEIVHYNTPTGCSLQHTYKLFTTTYPQVVHYNIPTSCSLQHTRKWFTIQYTHRPLCHYRQRTRSLAQAGQIINKYICYRQFVRHFMKWRKAIGNTRNA